MQHRAHLIGQPLGGSPLDDILNAVPARSPLHYAIRGKFTSGDYRKWVEQSDARTRQFAKIKPERTLGAPWIDEFVSQGKSVALCEECYRKYDKWWKTFNFEPRWHPKELTDCDGCSKTMVVCTGFYPRRLPTPNRRSK